jgi:hypothetical protein
MISSHQNWPMPEQGPRKCRPIDSWHRGARRQFDPTNGAEPRRFQWPGIEQIGSSVAIQVSDDKAMTLANSGKFTPSHGSAIEFPGRLMHGPERQRQCPRIEPLGATPPHRHGGGRSGRPAVRDDRTAFSMPTAASEERDP